MRARPKWQETKKQGKLAVMADSELPTAAAGLHQRDWRVVLSSLAVGLIAGACILYPSVYLWLSGYSIVHAFEEFVGHSYFYSLRSLYGVDDYPWFPHAHLILLAFRGVQVLLTAVGLPIDGLFPRVDIFSYTFALLPLAVATLALPWGLFPLKTMWGRASMAALFVALCYQSQWAPNVFTAPHYYPWAIPFGVVTLGWLLRQPGLVRPFNMKAAIYLGLFAGFALGFKQTYAVFPILVGLLYVLHAAWSKKLVLYTLLSCAIAGMIWLVIVSWYFGFSWVGIKHYVSALFDFLRNRNVTIPLPKEGNILAWLYDWGTAKPFDAGGLIAAAPFLFGLTFAALPRRRVSFACFLIGAIATLIYYQRFYLWTSVEYTMMIFAALGTWWCLVMLPWMRARFAGMGPVLGRTVGILGTLGLLGFSSAAAWPNRHIDLENIGNTAIYYQTIESTAAKRGGRLLILVPDNSLRIASLHSGICKGGMSSTNPFWGTGPLIADLFNRLNCVTVAKPIRLGDFASLVFVRNHDEPVTKARARLEKFYRIDLSDFVCPRQFKQGPTTVVVICLRESEGIAPPRVPGAFFTRVLVPRSGAVGQVVPPVNVPFAFKARGRAAGSILLEWRGRFSRDARLKIRRRPVGVSSFSHVGTVGPTARSHLNGGLQPNGQYLFVLRVCVKDDCVDYGPVSETVPVGHLQIPVGLHGAVGQDNLPWLSWRMRGDHEYFVIDKRTAEGKYQEIGRTAGGQMAFTFRKAVSGAIYELRVRACNSHGCSAPSNEVNLRVRGKGIPFEGSGLKLVDVTARSVSRALKVRRTFLSWGAEDAKVVPVDARRFEVEFSGKKQDRFLVVNRMYHPQWSIRAGGRSLEPIPVNGIMMGLVVPPGISRIKFVFIRDWAGIAAIAVGFSVIFLLAVGRVRRVLTQVLPGKGKNG